MAWFERAVERGCKSAMEKALQPGGILRKAVEDTVWQRMAERLDEIGEGPDLTRVGFIWAMKLHFVKFGCTREQASMLAPDRLREMLRDEKIKFGDPAYAWNREAARITCNEYEIDHWEGVAA